MADFIGLYFDGHVVIEEVIGHLKSHQGLGDAEGVVFSGESAG